MILAARSGEGAEGGKVRPPTPLRGTLGMPGGEPKRRRRPRVPFSRDDTLTGS